MDLFHIGIYFCKNDSPATDDTNWAWLVSPSGYLGGYVNHGVDNSYRRKKKDRRARTSTTTVRVMSSRLVMSTTTTTMSAIPTVSGHEL